MSITTSLNAVQNPVKHFDKITMSCIPVLPRK